MNKLFSMKDRKPELGSVCLVYCDYMPIRDGVGIFQDGVGIFKDDGWHWWDNGTCDKIDKEVTYWMPLLDQPKEV